MMEPIFIEGIGVITARGRGVDHFEQALIEGWKKPELSEDGRLAYRIPKELLQDRDVLQKARRADRFSRLAILSAYDAVQDSGLQLADIQNTRTGLIVATAFGGHSTIFNFLDDIIDYGETKVSPTTFAHSIHNAAASYVASVLGCQGPVITTTQFFFSFQQSLLLAYAWLQQGRIDRVLLGVADECSSAMEYICEEKLTIAADGKMLPLSYAEKPKLVPGEGSAFFLLSLSEKHKKYASITDIDLFGDTKGWDDVDLSIIGTHGMAGSEEVYRSLENDKRPTVAYADIYGGLMTASAFDCVAGSLMLKNQRIYRNVASECFQGKKQENDFKEKSLKQIQCVSHNCKAQLNFIKMYQ